jgi:hypothetical protein
VSQGYRAVIRALRRTEEMSYLPVMSAAVNFFIRGQVKQFALRRMYHVPRVGDSVIFQTIPYKVLYVDWCLDEDATDYGVRVNVEIEKNVT